MSSSVSFLPAPDKVAIPPSAIALCCIIVIPYIVQQKRGTSQSRRTIAVFAWMKVLSRETTPEEGSAMGTGSHRSPHTSATASCSIGQVLMGPEEASGDAGEIINGYFLNYCTYFKTREAWSLWLSSMTNQLCGRGQ